MRAIEELRAHRAVVDNKFTETFKLVTLAAQYGIKKAGRSTLIRELSAEITKQIRSLNEVKE